MAVHMTVTDNEEYSLRLNNVLDCTIYNQITVGNVTLPKAVLGTVKIFAVHYSNDQLQTKHSNWFLSGAGKFKW